MDGMNDVFGALTAQLPYFSPFGMINTSGTCATSRILQTRWMGCSTVDMSQKVAKGAGSPGPEQADFQRKHQCIKAVNAAAPAARNAGYACVLWKYQLCEGCGTRASDWGDLLFCDMTTTKWLVIQTGPSNTPALQQQAEQLGQQIFSLLTYIGYGPKYVRSCTFTSNSPQLPAGLMLQDGAQEGFKQVDPTNFVPSLNANLLDKIDTIIGRDASGLGKSIAKYREEEGGKEALRAKVLMSPSAEAQARAQRAAAPKVAQVCATCSQTAEEVGLEALKRCGRCRMVWYCCRDHQAAHWRTHKMYCKQEPAAETSTGNAAAAAEEEPAAACSCTK